MLPPRMFLLAGLVMAAVSTTMATYVVPGGFTSAVSEDSPGSGQWSGIYALAVDKNDGSSYFGGDFKGPLTLGAAGTLNSNGDYVGWVGKADVDGVYIWAKSLANGYVGGMATDSKGNVWASGTFQGTWNLGGSLGTITATSNNAFLLRMDAATGDFTAILQFAAAEAYIDDLSVTDTDEVFFAVSYVGVLSAPGLDPTPSATATTTMAVKVDGPSNTIMWGTLIASNNDYAWGYASTVNPLTGEGFVTGEFRGDTLSVGNGIVTVPACGTVPAARIYVVKLDTAGKPLWGVCAVSNFNSFAQSIATDPLTGDVYVAGQSMAAEPFVVYSGSQPSAVCPNPTGDSAPMFKLDASGNGVWVRCFGGVAGNPNFNNAPNAVFDTVSRTLYVGGMVNGMFQADGYTVDATVSRQVVIYNLSPSGDLRNLISYGPGPVPNSGAFVNGLGLYKGALILGGGFWGSDLLIPGLPPLGPPSQEGSFYLLARGGPAITGAFKANKITLKEKTPMKRHLEALDTETSTGSVHRGRLLAGLPHAHRNKTAAQIHRDRWAFKGMLDTANDPTFIADAATAGVTVALLAADGTVLDVAQFAAQECQTTSGGRKLTCMYNGMPGRLTFTPRGRRSKSSTSTNYAVSGTFNKRNLDGGAAAANTPLSVSITNAPRTYVNGPPSCKVYGKGKSIVCAQK